MRSISLGYPNLEVLKVSLSSSHFQTFVKCLEKYFPKTKKVVILTYETKENFKCSIENSLGPGAVKELFAKKSLRIEQLPSSYLISQCKT